ncbi:MAG: MaoC family dehydratase N-terminal domain-containing protein [Caulobacteraceae bacterium]|nr:MaoC family dehydratase N-terminal domain-containing protein [Caulobacteraceae bacterium]
MPIFYPDILDQKTAPRTFTYGDKDVMLYALGIGLGRDPMNETELPFVYEKGLKVVPTAATVLASGMRGQAGPAPKMPDGHRPSQINFLMVVHGEQKVELHKPLPTSGTFTAEGRTIGAFDKGEGKGAVIINETTWKNEAGELVATLTGSTFARGDGGFGGPSEGAPEPHETPARKADFSIDFETREDQALLYRLNGDRNPLHSDPESARRSGVQRPILHGLCTYGITCRAVLQGITNFDPDRIFSHQARFSAPVIPGDVITVDMWQDGKVISFEARVKDRGATVIKNGKTVLR